jgi:hypothetical protein
MDDQFRADQPIVCTLGSDDVGQRSADWHTAVAAATNRAETETGVRLMFAPDPALAAQIAQLAVAETHCCSFFRMTLTMAADELTLDIACPPSARPILDELIALAPPDDA